MPFDDLFDPVEEIHNLKIEIEELKQEIQNHKGLSNVILKQRQNLSYLLKEASFFMHEFENAMSEDDFKKCEKAANKKYEAWLRKEFEIDQVSVDVSLKP